MLYCICAFFKCILEVRDVVHDILPYLFEMQDKTQPKALIPSPAAWRGRSRSSPAPS